MEDKIINKPISPYVPTEEERIEKQYRDKYKELKIGRMRAAVVRSQILEAYKILESIRFNYVSDTMFRDYITSAQKSLESATSDFLMSDTYWEKQVEKHKKMSFKEYDDFLETEKKPFAESGGSYNSK